MSRKQNKVKTHDSMRKFLLLTLLAILCFVAFTYDVLNHAINADIKKINQYLSEQTNSNISVKDIDISIEKITAHDIEISTSNEYVVIDEATLTFKNYKDILKSYFLGEIAINSDSIKNVYFKNVDFFSLKNTNSKGDLSYLKTYVDSIENLEIEYLKLNSFLFHDVKINKKNFKTVWKVGKNKIKVNGQLDILDFIENNNIDMNLYLETSKFDLTDINKYFDSSTFSIIGGNVDGKLNISYINKDWKIDGYASVNDYGLSFFNKKVLLNKFNVNTKLTNNELSFNFPNKIFSGETLLDINDIDFLFSENMENIKSIKIKSDNLTYEGVFSENFLKEEESKILFNFNLVDLNYFNLLNVLRIEEPINKTILKDGESVFFFKKNKGKFKIDYLVKSKAELLIENKNLEADLTIENEILTVKNLSVDKSIKKADLIYNLLDNEFSLGVNDKINNEIFATVKKIFKLDFNFDFIDKNEALLLLKLDNKNKKLKYSGDVIFEKNNLILNLGLNNKIEIMGAIGKVSFDEKNVFAKNLLLNKIKRKNTEILDIKLDFFNNENNINFNFIGNLAKGKIDFDKKKSLLLVNLDNLNYKISDEEAKKIIVDNQEIVKEIDLPNIVVIKIDDFYYDKYKIGKLSLKSIKDMNRENSYDINSTIENDSGLLNAKLYLAENMNLNAKLNIDIKNPEKFSDIYQIKKTIKNSNIEIKGELLTNINELSANKIIGKTSGVLSVNSKNGEFVDMDTGIGFLLSVFNFRTLPDIIMMDFSSIFNKNLTYDIINSELSIKNGVVNIDKTEIKSKISEMNLKGVVDLNSEKLDLNLEVTPKLTNSIVFTAVSIATGFNPISLLGSAIVDKIIPMPNIIKYNYKIFGTIRNPEIK